MSYTIDESAKIGKNFKIDYGAVIFDNVIIGDDCFVGCHSVVRPKAVIGNNSEIRAHCFIAEGAKIGNYVTVYQLSSICQLCVIEDRVFIGPGTMTTNTKKISYARDYTSISKGPYIKFGARIGAGSILLPGVIIGENSMIQAGSLVSKDTDPYGIYRGRPAVKIGEVLEDERI